MPPDDGSMSSEDLAAVAQTFFGAVKELANAQSTFQRAKENLQRSRGARRFHKTSERPSSSAKNKGKGKQRGRGKSRGKGSSSSKGRKGSSPKIEGYQPQTRNPKPRKGDSRGKQFRSPTHPPRSEKDRAKSAAHYADEEEQRFMEAFTCFFAEVESSKVVDGLKESPKSEDSPRSRSPSNFENWRRAELAWTVTDKGLPALTCREVCSGSEDSSEDSPEPISYGPPSPNVNWYHLNSPSDDELAWAVTESRTWSSFCPFRWSIADDELLCHDGCNQAWLCHFRH